MSDFHARPAFPPSPNPEADGRKPPPSLLIGIVVNLVLPVLISNRLRAPFGDLAALLASAAVPLVWALREFMLRRRLDLLSAFALGGVALSLLAFAGGGSVRALQLRPTFVLALIGLAFLVSAATSRPLIRTLARAGAARKSPEALAAFDAGEAHPGFRRKLRIMTLVWGGGLLVAAAVAFRLAFVLPPGAFQVVGPAVGYGAMALLALWTWCSSRRKSPRRDDLRATSRLPS